MPPNAIQEMANHPCNQVMGGVVRDRHAPNTAAVIPRDQQPATTNAREPLRGYAPPLSNPPGTGPGSAADRIVDEFDRRDRAQLARKLKGG
jgi:hypothetical protein